MVIETRNTPRKTPRLVRSESTESDFYEEFEKQLKMVKTRRAAKAPAEIQLEGSPQKNGLPAIEENGIDEEMEVDKQLNEINGKKKSIETVGETPKMDKKVLKEKLKSKEKTMKEKLEQEKAKEPSEAPVIDDQNEQSSTKGGSMAVLLTQGLMAHDATKVDTVLRVYHHQAIQATLKDLNIAHVIPLLKAIEQRLRTRNATDIRRWLRWLQYTMSRHMAYLSSQRSLDKELSGLMEWMKARALHQQKLYQLQGKLGVLTDQILNRSKSGSSSTPQPMIIFNNDELNDSDEELESLGSDESGASSEEDWWDEGGIRQDNDEDEDDEDEEDEDEELEDIGGGLQPGGDNDYDEDEEDDDEDDEEMEED